MSVILDALHRARGGAPHAARRRSGSHDDAASRPVPAGLRVGARGSRRGAPRAVGITACVALVVALAGYSTTRAWPMLSGLRVRSTPAAAPIRATAAVTPPPPLATAPIVTPSAPVVTPNAAATDRDAVVSAKATAGSRINLHSEVSAAAEASPAAPQALLARRRIDITRPAYRVPREVATPTPSAEPPPLPAATTSAAAAAPRLPAASAVNHFDLAVRYHGLGDFEQAVKNYLAVIDADEFNVEARNNLGLLYHDRGLVNESVEQFRKAIAINPQYLKARSNLAVVLMDAGRLTEARAELTAALRLEPRNVDLLVNLALVEKSDRHPDVAVETLLRAIGYQPVHALAHYNLALLYEEKGQIGQACDHYTVYLQNAGPEQGALLADVRRRVEALHAQLDAPGPHFR